MAHLQVILIESGITWVLLVVTMLVAQRLIDVSFPPVGEFAYKTLLIAVVPVAVAHVLIYFVGLGPFFASIVAFITFLVMLNKLLEFDLLQSIILVVVMWAVRVAIFLFLLGATSGAILKDY